MSTQINIDASGFISLKQQADKVSSENRQAASENLEKAKLTKEVRLQRSKDNFKELAERFRQNTKNRESRSPAKDRSLAGLAAKVMGNKSDVPEVEFIRELSAPLVVGGLWFYCRNWVSRVHRVWVSGPATFNELDYYDVHEESTVKHYISSLAAPNKGKELFSNQVPEHLFKYGGSWDVQPNLDFMNIDNGGPREWIEPPVYSCANGFIYGMQRHTECWTKTPLTDDFSGDPVCTWTCKHWFIFFKINASSGSLETNIVERSSSSTTISGWGPGDEDLAPWRWGGAEWCATYEANAFPDDPSISLRAQGYTGQYQLKASQDGELGKAYFVYVNETLVRGTQYESYQSHHTQRDTDMEYFYNAGNSSNTGQNLSAWDYWQNLEVMEFDEPTSLEEWRMLDYLTSPAGALQRYALDGRPYSTATGEQVELDQASTTRVVRQQRGSFDRGTNKIYKLMFDYSNPPENLKTSPHNPPTSYQQDQDRWWEPKLHPLLYLL